MTRFFLCLCLGSSWVGDGFPLFHADLRRTTFLLFFSEVDTARGKNGKTRDKSHIQ
jgi:hypothetical protein